MQELYQLWLKQIAERDKQAFKLLFNEFYIPLLAVAKHFVNPEAAEDIVQEVFLKLWNNPGRHEEITSLKSFLYISVRNLCYNHLRDERNHQKVLSNLAEQDDVFYEAVMDEEVFLELRKAVEELPEQYRKVIQMTLDGMKASEIAQKLDTTEESVKSMKKRSRNILRKKLGDGAYLFFLL